MLGDTVRCIADPPARRVYKIRRMTERMNCPWTPPWLARLYAERAAYELELRLRAGPGSAKITSADIDAEVAMLRALSASSR